MARLFLWTPKRPAVSTPEWVLVSLKVIEVFEALNVPYFVGGSAASIIHGIVRTTIDSDIVAELKEEHIEPLVAALADEFYVEREAILEAIVLRRSFNLIHQDTMFKVDVFIPKRRAFDQAQLARRVKSVVAREPQRTAWIATAEDTVLAKLDWFRTGGEVSERQWRDVLGVLKTQAGRLDTGYMHEMASALGVNDLLEAALEEAAK